VLLQVWKGLDHPHFLLLGLELLHSSPAYALGVCTGQSCLLLRRGASLVLPLDPFLSLCRLLQEDGRELPAAGGAGPCRIFSCSLLFELLCMCTGQTCLPLKVRGLFSPTSKPVALSLRTIAKVPERAAWYWRYGPASATPPVATRFSRIRQFVD
jgi:hypothetical protein